MKKSRRWRYLIRGSPFLTQQPAPRPSFLPFSTNLFCHKVGLAPLSRREVEGEKWNLFIFQSLLQIDAPLDYCQKLIDQDISCFQVLTSFSPSLKFLFVSSAFKGREKEISTRFTSFTKLRSHRGIHSPPSPLLAGLTRGLVSTQCHTWPGIRIIIISSPLLKGSLIFYCEWLKSCYINWSRVSLTLKEHQEVTKQVTMHNRS